MSGQSAAFPLETCVRYTWHSSKKSFSPLGSLRMLPPILFISQFALTGVRVPDSVGLFPEEIPPSVAQSGPVRMNASAARMPVIER